MRAFLLGLLLFLIPSLTTAKQLVPADGGPVAQAALTARLDALIEKAVPRQIVGAVVIITRNGQVLYRKAHGLADREAGRPMEVTTVFRLASMTKPLVVAAALRLHDQGRLSLDDPVSRWLAGFTPALPDGRKPAITIRHLLTHTAGLNYPFLERQDGPYHRLGVGDGLEDNGITLDENIRRIAQAPLLAEPGSQWQYSVATDVLGAVIERVTGQPLPAAMEQLITGPLGMQATRFTAVSHENMAVPYADGTPQPVRMATRQVVPFGGSTVIFSPGRAFNPKAFPSGGAGMVGTAGDFSRFLEAIRSSASPLLQPASRRAVLTNAAGKLYEPARGQGWGWSLMASLVEYPKPTGSPMQPGSLEWGGAYGHNWWLDPQAGLCGVILTNTAFAGMSGAFPDQIKHAVYTTLGFAP